MRLSVRLTSKIYRLLPSSEFLAWAGVAGLLIGLELIGRLTERDMHDLLAAMSLWSALCLFAMRRRQQSWASLSSTAMRVLRWFDIFRYDHGIDLRGEPLYPSRLPPMFLVVSLAMFASLAGAAGLWWVFPLGWRELGMQTSYVVYLLIFSAVWLGLLIGIMFALWMTFRVIDDQVQKLSGRSPQEARSMEFVVLIGYLMTLMTFAHLVPTIMAPLTCLVIACVSCALLLRQQETVPALLWRFGPERPIFRVATTRLLAAVVLLAALLVTCLIVAACGGHLWSRPEKTDPMLLTHVLGMMTAWLMPGLFILMAIRLHATLHRDPANQTPLTLSVYGIDLAPAQRKLIRDCAAQENIWCRFRLGKPRKNGFGIEIVPEGQSEAFEFMPSWPLKVSVNDLVHGAVFARIIRRDELIRRRKAMRGVKTLLKRSAAIRKRLSGGFLFAPHWWIMEGLQREEQSSAKQPRMPKIVRPTYQELYPPRVRQYWYTVLRALQVDMVFIEDGVPARAFLKILRQLFDVYDKSSGQRAVQEHLLSHVPKVRVQIDQWMPGQETVLHRNHDYATSERHYDELHRARVMLIFRDDDGATSEEKDPFDFSWEPSPSLGIT